MKESSHPVFYDSSFPSPLFLLSFRRRCLLTKQAAIVLNRTAAARKQMVATMPATTGRASPRSSTISGGGKKSVRRGGKSQGRKAGWSRSVTAKWWRDDGEGEGCKKEGHDSLQLDICRYRGGLPRGGGTDRLTRLLIWHSTRLMLMSTFIFWLWNSRWYLLWDYHADVSPRSPARTNCALIRQLFNDMRNWIRIFWCFFRGMHINPFAISSFTLCFLLPSSQKRDANPKICRFRQRSLWRASERKMPAISNEFMLELTFTTVCVFKTGISARYMPWWLSRM